MSWLSSAFSSIKSIGSKVLSVAKKVVTPLASFAAGLVPGIGPILSKGVDMLGNTLLGESGDPSSDAGAAEQTPVMDMLTQSNGVALAMSSSPAAQALSAATSPVAAESSATSPGWLARTTGIGDGKPGVLGIGTGKNKAAKLAASGEYQPGTTTPEYSPTPSSSGSSGGIIAAVVAAGAALLFL